MRISNGFFVTSVIALITSVGIHAFTENTPFATFFVAITYALWAIYIKMIEDDNS